QVGPQVPGHDVAARGTGLLPYDVARPHLDLGRRLAQPAAEHDGVQDRPAQVDHVHPTLAGDALDPNHDVAMNAGLPDGGRLQHQIEGPPGGNVEQADQPEGAAAEQRGVDDAVAADVVEDVVGAAVAVDADREGRAHRRAGRAHPLVVDVAGADDAAHEG